jgi:hypothetical protein
LWQFRVCWIVIVIRRFNQYFVMPNGAPETFAFHNICLISWVFWRSEGWKKVWNAPNKPVLGAKTVLVSVFFYVSVLFQVDQDGWGRHVLVAWAHGADAGLGWFLFLFSEVRGSSGALSGDYDPAV